MAEPILKARSPLAGVLRAGRHGRQAGPPGVVLRECADVQIASLAARQGQVDALAAAVRDGWDLELPQTPRRVGDARLAFVWTGPGQWLAVSSTGSGVLDVLLRERLRGLASVAAQGDGRVVLWLGGPHARDVLAKGIGIDLHPRAFRPGDTAITLAGHIGVQLWQLDDEPSYELAAFRGYAGSFYGWLVSAGEEYGIDVLARG